MLSVWQNRDLAADRESGRRITFVNRFYWPAIAATGQMLTELAEDMAASGWDVTVITGRNHYNAANEDGRARDERRNGVRILRVGTTALGAGGLVGRFLEYFTYHFFAFARLLKLKDPGVVTCMSDPPLLLLAVSIGKFFRGYKVAYWVQDLYPQLLAELGFAGKRGLAYKAIKSIFHGLHSRCDAVIALGPSMERAMIYAGARPERTSFVHNWADTEKIYPVDPSRNSFRADNNLAGKFVVLYSGNAGRAHEFDTLLRAIVQLRNESEIVFVFVGGGHQIPELKAFAAANKLCNIRFLDYQPLDRLASSLSAADVSVVSELESVAGLLLPSKTYGVLASGRPLIFIGSGESDVANIVRSTGAGRVIAPRDSDRLVQFIQFLWRNPDEVARLGERAREAAEQLYSREYATRRWPAVLDRLLQGRASEELRTHVHPMPEHAVTKYRPKKTAIRA